MHTASLRAGGAEEPIHRLALMFLNQHELLRKTPQSGLGKPLKAHDQYTVIIKHINT